jgi:hypothetical protein
MKAMREWFGPSRKEIWKQLAAAVDGKFVEGGWAKGDKVEVTHEGWVLTLDTYAVSTGKVVIIFTRMRAPYVNPRGFRFTIYRKGFFTGLAKLLGMQDVEVGHEPFDTDFVIKGNDELLLRELFADARLRELIEQQKDIQFSVKDDEGWFGTHFPEGVDELSFNVPGVIKDVERLKLLFDLFAETLDQLCRIGSATKDAPGVTLK